MPAFSEAIVRELLVKHWMEQACRDPADRPAVIARLMKDGPATPGGSSNNHGRGSLKPAVDEGVAALVSTFAGGPPADPPMAVWRAFPRLDGLHCATLATALIELTR